MPPLEQALIGTAGLSAIVSVSLTIYLVALKLAAFDVVPARVLPRINRWRRRARPCLWAGLAITAAALAVTLLLRIG